MYFVKRFGKNKKDEKRLFEREVGEVILNWIVKISHVDSLLMVLNISSMLYFHVEFRRSASRYNYVPQAWSNGGATLQYAQPASTVQYAQPAAFAEPRVQLVAASRGLYLF